MTLKPAARRERSGEHAFDGIAVQDMAPLHLYARAADRIEAATRLAVGRTIDITA